MDPQSKGRSGPARRFGALRAHRSTLGCRQPKAGSARFGGLEAHQCLRTGNIHHVPGAVLSHADLCAPQQQLKDEVKRQSPAAPSYKTRRPGEVTRCDQGHSEQVQGQGSSPGSST